MLHVAGPRRIFSKAGSLFGLVLDQGDDHAVEVEEEHDEVESELDEGLLHIYISKDAQTHTNK